jgi:peptide-methionine (S)-S-oxide reductase
MDGVVSTHVGYAGGMKKNPSYYSLRDHTETIRINYDPKEVSYEQLLNVFWMSHDPAAQSSSRQYKSIIFYENEEQKSLALATKARLEEQLKRKILTEIVPAGEFYPAEGYHQKYMLRGSKELMHILKEIYPADADLVASTAAARLNGYLSFMEKPGDIEKELREAGLPAAAITKILNVLKGQRVSGSCPV